MKKLFVLVSCFAVLLFVSNVSFAQEGVAVEAVPCTCCCTCGVVAPAFAFAYSPHAPKIASHRLGGLRARCAVATPFPAPAVMLPASPHLHPAFLHAAPDARPFAVRRAARTAAPQPILQQFASFPVAAAPPAAPAAPVFLPAPAPPVQSPMIGDFNRVHQRVGGAPVINFMSIVRAPRPYVNPYAAHYFQHGYPLPAMVPAQ